MKPQVSRHWFLSLQHYSTLSFYGRVPFISGNSRYVGWVIIPLHQLIMPQKLLKLSRSEALFEPRIELIQCEIWGWNIELRALKWLVEMFDRSQMRWNFLFTKITPQQEWVDPASEGDYASTSRNFNPPPWNNWWEIDRYFRVNNIRFRTSFFLKTHIFFWVWHGLPFWSDCRHSLSIGQSDSTSWRVCHEEISLMLKRVESIRVLRFQIRHDVCPTSTSPSSQTVKVQMNSFPVGRLALTR